MKNNLMDAMDQLSASIGLLKSLSKTLEYVGGMVECEENARQSLDYPRHMYRVTKSVVDDLISQLEEASGMLGAYWHDKKESA